jgi:hypothetical protein
MYTSFLTNVNLRWQHVAWLLAGLTLLGLVTASWMGPAPVLAQTPATGTPAPGAPAAAGAQAWIENPTEGESLPLAPVRLVAYATDSQGVASVELRMNGDLLPAQETQEQSFESSRRLLRVDHQWTPPKEGKYILEARGLNNEGGYGEPDFVQFCVGACPGMATPTATSTPTLPPSPTAAATPSPTSSPSPAPLRVTFTADRTSLQAGQCTTIRWSVEGPVAAVQVNGQDVPRTALSEVCPPRTTTFILMATGTDGSQTTRQVTVAVEAPTPSPTVPPTLTATPFVQVTFSADRTSLVAGECAVLQWAVQGDVGMVTLNGQPVNPTGQNRVCPPGTTVYTLAAIRTDGAPTQRSVTIAVQGITPSPTRPADIQFWADSNIVAAGACTTLRWHVTGVQAYWVDGQPGAGDDGSRQVCPCQTETHTLRAIRLDGSQQDFQVTIRVRGQCVTPTPTATTGRPPLQLVPVFPILTPTRPIIR